MKYKFTNKLYNKSESSQSLLNHKEVQNLKVIIYNINV